MNILKHAVRFASIVVICAAAFSFAPKSALARSMVGGNCIESNDYCITQNHNTYPFYMCDTVVVGTGEEPPPCYTCLYAASICITGYGDVSEAWH